jgi:hypothetical protein
MPLKFFQWDKKPSRNSKGRKKKKKKKKKEREREREKKKAVGLVPCLFDTTFSKKNLLRVFMSFGGHSKFLVVWGEILMQS